MCRSADTLPALNFELRRFDFGRIDAGLVGDALRQRRELHRFAECDRLCAVDRLDREIIERHIERHIVGERHKLARDARLVGVLD